MPVDNGFQSVSVIAPTRTDFGILSTSAYIFGQDKGIEFLAQAQDAGACLWVNGERRETSRFRRYAI